MSHSAQRRKRRLLKHQRPRCRWCRKPIPKSRLWIDRDFCSAACHEDRYDS